MHSDGCRFDVGRVVRFKDIFPFRSYAIISYILRHNHCCYKETLQLFIRSVIIFENNTSV